MPAERGLSASALFGKHPAFGDFVVAGDLPGESTGRIMDWLAQTLGAWRDGAGANWQAVFDRAPALRFWIGAALGNGGALRGVLVPLHDRSGRRFPLVIAQATTGLAPVVDSDQGFHDLAEAELRALAALDGFDPRETAAALSARLPAIADQQGAQGASFWALNPNHRPEELLAELQATDIAHAQAGRSYWWFAAREDAGMPGGVLVCAGWPGPAEMGWLLAGGHNPQPAAPAPEDAANEARA